MPYLGLPWARFVFPHAPQLPVTINGGLIMPAWYDVTHLGAGGASERHVDEARQLVETLLEDESATIPTSRIVLAGFSQGGAVALHTGIRYRHPLAGLMILSAYELFPERRSEACDENAATPILFAHGSHDPMVPVDRGRAAAEAYETGDRQVEWHEFPIGHEVSMPEIEVIGAWLRARLA